MFESRCASHEAKSGTFTSAYSHQKPTASCGPSGGGWPALSGHWLFAYVYGNHVRFYGVCDEVEMYVS